jgi:tRNA(Leu) C34 or U34 (ribose-2'-O)-methylase TrmL
MDTPISIQSAENIKLKNIKQLLLSKKARHQHQSFIIENERFIFDVFSQNPKQVLSVFYDEKYPILNTPMYQKIPCFSVKSALFKSLHHVKTSCGIIAIAQYPSWDIPQNPTKVLVLDGIQNPANLGAIFRSAAAFQLDHIYLLPSTTDPFHPESVRAMAGQYYTISYSEQNWATIEDTLKDFHWIQLDSNSKIMLSDLSISRPWVLFIGSETGFKTQFSKTIEKIRIPIHTQVESLNVTVAASIAMHWLTLT